MVRPLTQSMVDQMVTMSAEAFLWDKVLPGFGVRVYPSGRKTFFVQFRDQSTTGRQVRRAIGNVGVVSLKEARKVASELLARNQTRQSPFPERAMDNTTLQELYQLWVEHASERHRTTGSVRSGASVRNDRQRIELHVLPRLGLRRLRDIRRADVEAVRDAAAQKVPARTKGGKGYRGSIGGDQAAKRTVATLKSVLAFGFDRGLLNANVAVGVRLAPDRARQVFLSEGQFKAVFAAIQDARQTHSAASCDILTLLCVTGCRKSEIEALRWSQVSLDIGLIRAGTKSGPRDIQLSAVAIETLRRQLRTRSPYVFPAKGNPASYHQGTKRVWERIRKAQGLEAVRIHDLRHSFASLLAKNGSSLLLIGKALGHSRTQTTLRYAHLTDSELRAAVEGVSATLSYWPPTD